MSNARTLASTINSNSEIVVPSGGIAFTDLYSSNDPTTANEAYVMGQDGYEEGSWNNSGVSALSNISFTTAVQTGKYIKIGKQVTLFYTNTTGSITSSGTDIKLAVDGLPFLPSRTSIGSLWDGYREMSGTVQTSSGNNYISLHFDSEVVDFTGNCYINFTITYLTS